jgi:hypothetical protein
LGLPINAVGIYIPKAHNIAAEKERSVRVKETVRELGIAIAFNTQQSPKVQLPLAD